MKGSHPEYIKNSYNYVLNKQANKQNNNKWVIDLNRCLAREDI